MKLGIGRYRLRIGLQRRCEPADIDRVIDGDRTDRDLAQLAQAEREYHDTLWKTQSILN